MSVDDEDNIHNNDIEISTKENKYHMKTSDYETKIETHIVIIINDTIFDREKQGKHEWKLSQEQIILNLDHPMIRNFKNV